MPMNTDHDPELTRLFAEARGTLPAADFITDVAERLARVRRRRMLFYCVAVAILMAVLVVLAPDLIDASLAMSAALTAVNSPTFWIAGLLIGGFALLWTRRGLRR